jgi:hypothetical protein
LTCALARANPWYTPWPAAKTGVGMNVQAMTPVTDDANVLPQQACDVNRDDTVFDAYRRIYASLSDQIVAAIVVLEVHRFWSRPARSPLNYSSPAAQERTALKQQGPHMI